MTVPGRPACCSFMSGELEKRRWSVISERGCEESGLTHEEARRLVHRLGGEGRHGLCIITDEAARRMSPVEPASSLDKFEKAF